jgi:hypothetical protein
LYIAAENMNFVTLLHTVLIMHSGENCKLLITWVFNKHGFEV